MKNNALQYTFRVWVTSVLVSPFVFTLILMIRQVISVSDLIDNGFRLVGIYIFLVVLQLLFSFATWLVFLLLVYLILYIRAPDSLIKPVIFCIGMLLAIGTYIALNTVFGAVEGPDSFINLAYANCAGVGWGVWYYTLHIKNVERYTDTEESSFQNK